MSHPFRYRYKERHNNCWRKFPKSSGNLPPLLRASTLSEVRTDPILHSSGSKDLNTLSSFLNLRVVDIKRCCGVRAERVSSPSLKSAKPRCAATCAIRTDI